MQFGMARSKANENLHKLSPILYDTLGHLGLMPYRELATPEDLKAALQGVDRLLVALHLTVVTSTNAPPGV
jgi:hypothetical protein